jgi:hypothetical protein
MLASEWVREIVCYVAVGDMVWRVRRVNSAALAAEGHAHLEGSEAYRAVQAEIARERREHLASLNQTDLEARAAAIASARFFFAWRSGQNANQNKKCQKQNT